jgi:uncharacterized protein YnzC (UPF0291/DUF896 family)
MEISEKTKRKIESIKEYFLKIKGKELTEDEIIEMALDRLMLDLQLELFFKKVVDYVKKYD